MRLPLFIWRKSMTSPLLNSSTIKGSQRANLGRRVPGIDRGQVHGLLAFLAHNAYCHFDIHQLRHVTEASVLGACNGVGPMSLLAVPFVAVSSIQSSRPFAS